MTIGQRVKQLRKSKGMTQEELAATLGYKSKSSVAHIENGRDIPKAMIVELANILNTTPAYLMGWTQYGTQLRKARLHFGVEIEELSVKTGISTDALKKYEQNDSEPSNEELALIAAAYGVDLGSLLWSSFEKPTTLEPNATMLPDSNVRMIPVYESVAAGFGAHAENVVVDYMPLYIVSSAEAENTLIIRVEGNSMYPKIEDGDSIQVLRQDYAENGQVAVLLIDGEDAVVKQFFHDPKAKRVTLHSLNPDYMDRVFEGIEITKLRVLGVVKRVIKDI